MSLRPCEVKGVVDFDGWAETVSCKCICGVRGEQNKYLQRFGTVGE